LLLELLIVDSLNVKFGKIAEIIINFLDLIEQWVYPQFWQIFENEAVVLSNFDIGSVSLVVKVSL
jgi:hypothetical protein